MHPRAVQWDISDVFQIRYRAIDGDNAVELISCGFMLNN